MHYIFLTIVNNLEMHICKTKVKLRIVINLYHEASLVPARIEGDRMWRKMIVCALAVAMLACALVPAMDEEHSIEETNDVPTKMAVHKARAGYIAHSPIRINNNVEFDAQFPGRVISGLDIDGTGYGYCIYIGNVTGAYMITDCYLHDASGNEGEYYQNAAVMIWGGSGGNISGVLVEGCKYGVRAYSTSWLDVHECDFDSEYGIRLSSVTNSMLWNNTAHGGACGIMLNGAPYNTIFWNEVYSCTDKGISIEESYATNISYNHVWDCPMGIYAYATSGAVIFSNNVTACSYGVRITSADNATVKMNDVCSNDYGIYCYNSVWNKVENNTLRSNNVGMRLSVRSENNSVWGNVVYWSGNTGVYLSNSMNNVIANNTLANNTESGIYFEDSNFTRVENNTVSGSNYGIHAGPDGHNATIRRNELDYNNDGIFVSYSECSRVLQNRLVANRRSGVRLNVAVYIYISGNIMTKCGISLFGLNVQNWNTHEIDMTNTASAKPVMYYKNATTLTVPNTAGQAILANCTNMTVSGITFTDAGIAIQEAFSKNSAFTSNTITGGYYGTYSYNCLNTAINGNVISVEQDGIYLSSCIGPKVSNNNLSSCYWGIAMSSTTSATIQGNNASLCDSGMFLNGVSGCSFSSNTLNDNIYGIYLDSSSSNSFASNIMMRCGFFILGSSFEWASLSIPTTNSVNGKPVLYLDSEMDLVYSGATYGQVIIAACTNCIISSMDLSNTTCGVLVGFSTGIVLEGVTANSNNIYGIYSYDSWVYIGNSTARGNALAGIDFCHGSLKCTIVNANISGSATGIEFFNVYDNLVNSSHISNCGKGIWQTSGTRNFYVNNTISSCGEGAHIDNGLQDIIANNTIFSSGIGVMLNASSKNVVMNNNTVYLCGRGISIVNSDMNTITSSNASSNFDGIVLEGSMSNVLANNSAKANMNANFALRSSGGNLIEYSNATGSVYGFRLESSNNNSMTMNNANDNDEGYSLVDSWFNSIALSAINNSGRAGVAIYSSEFNNVSQCAINGASSLAAISLDNSPRNRLFGNDMTNASISIFGETVEAWSTQTIDASNMVNSKPVSYIANANNANYALPETGELIIANCINVSVSDTMINGILGGAVVAFSSMCRLVRMNISASHDGYAVVLFHSSSSELSDSNVSDARIGVLAIHSDGTIVKRSNISSNDVGLDLQFSRSSTVTHNVFSSNVQYAIKVENSTGQNVFYSNAFISNGNGETLQAWDDSSVDIWYSDDALTGNYWSAWTTPDSNSDGIVDVRYDMHSVTPSDPTNILCDLYPLTYLPGTNMPPMAFIIDVVPSNISAYGEPLFAIGAGVDMDGMVVGYSWSSNISGIIGTSPTLNASALPVGVHNVSFMVCDETGTWSLPKYVELCIGEAHVVENIRPECNVTSITPNPAYTSDSVSFVGFAFDWDGYITEYKWTSSIMGLLATGGTSPQANVNFTYSGLAVGTHVISLFVKDNNGTWSYAQNWTLVVESPPVPPIPNSKPTATITSIVPIVSNSSQGVTFMGAASDADGIIVAYQWTSSRDGTLSTLPLFATNTLSIGNHTIYFMAQDDDGEWSNASTMNITVLPPSPNVMPSAWIESISTTNAPYGSTIMFTGNASDPDGTVAFYRWYSNIDGNLSNARIFATNALSVGNHTIYFSAQDDDGAWSDFVMVNLTIIEVPLNHAPQVQFASSIPQNAFMGDSVAFVGNVTDDDGTIVAYRWYSSLDGNLSTQLAFTTNSLSVGTHMIYFTAQDDDGAWAPVCSSEITISPKGANVAPEITGTFADVVLNDDATLELAGCAHDDDDPVSNLTWSVQCDSLLVSATLDTANQRVLIKRTCAATASGLANLTLKLSDTHGLYDTVEVSIKVLKKAANDTNGSSNVVTKEPDLGISLVLLVVGIVAGFAIGYFFVRSRMNLGEDAHRKVVPPMQTHEAPVQQGQGNGIQIPQAPPQQPPQTQNQAPARMPIQAPPDDVTKVKAAPQVEPKQENKESPKPEIPMTSTQPQCAVQDAGQSALPKTGVSPPLPIGKLPEGESPKPVITVEKKPKVAPAQTPWVVKDGNIPRSNGVEPKAEADKKPIETRTLPGVGIVLGQKHPEKEQAMLNKIDEKIKLIEGNLDAITDQELLESIIGSLKLAKTYKMSRNFEKSLKFVERAEHEMGLAKKE